MIKALLEICLFLSAATWLSPQLHDLAGWSHKPTSSGIPCQSSGVSQAMVDKSRLQLVPFQKVEMTTRKWTRQKDEEAARVEGKYGDDGRLAVSPASSKRLLRRHES